MEDNKAEQRKQVQKEIMSLSTAILAGAVIVGASVIFASNLLLNKLDNGVGNEATVRGGAVPEEMVEVAQREDAPKRGGGEVVVYEFSDFQCPFCKSFWSQTYQQLKEDYIDTGKITFIYRHFPLTFHVNAEKAAEASECANKQGKFWDYHDLLFKNAESDGGGLEVEDLEKYASDLNLDTEEFNSCLKNGETADIVKADSDEAGRVGVTGTPTFFINGKKLVGARTYSEFEKVIEDALKAR